MIFDGELYRHDVNKISYVLGSYRDFLDTRGRFPDLESGTWGGRGATALFGDLGVKGITKAHAIDRLLAHLGANRQDTVAFGKETIMHIVLCCNQGMSTSMLVKKMREAAAKNGVDVQIDAYPISEIEEKAPDAAVILLGPQVRFELNRVKGLFPNIPVESINPQDYGLVRGENVLNHAIELAGK